ncbi:C40 family peptidase [bacterium]|nr:C40 family peptidase [bacterium]
MNNRISHRYSGKISSLFKPKYFFEDGFRGKRLGLLLVLLCFSISGCVTVLPRLPYSGKVLPVITMAKSLQGKPYRYGGTTPKGFDCSGFVQHVFREAAGIRLPRTSRAQFSATRAVWLGSEQPSDLLFFNISGYGISHVGIYLGRGKFIHASQTGGKVRISDANQKYWQQRFRGVRRAL